MDSKRYIITNKFIRFQMNKIKKGDCMICGKYSEILEFAHIKPTGLKGIGRGRNKRYYDFIHNRDSYILTCKRCNNLMGKTI